MSNREICRCVSCATCGGSGRIEVETGTYPETELETCPDCRGEGVEDLCEHCRKIKERRPEDYGIDA